MSAHHEAWQAIVDSADQPAAVARHLAYGQQPLRSMVRDILGRPMFAAVHS